MKRRNAAVPTEMGSSVTVASLNDFMTGLL